MSDLVRLSLLCSAVGGLCFAGGCFSVPSGTPPAGAIVGPELPPGERFSLVQGRERMSTSLSSRWLQSFEPEVALSLRFDAASSPYAAGVVQDLGSLIKIHVPQPAEQKLPRYLLQSSMRREGTMTRWTMTLQRNAETLWRESLLLDDRIR